MDILWISGADCDKFRQMITAEQIAFIAELSPETDFRFMSSFGKTIVIVPVKNGRYEKSEDGTLSYMSWKDVSHSSGQEVPLGS